MRLSESRFLLKRCKPVDGTGALRSSVLAAEDICCYTKLCFGGARGGPAAGLAACKTLANGASLPAPEWSSYVTPSRRSGHARTFGVIVVVVVDLLRAVLADLVFQVLPE